MGQKRSSSKNQCIPGRIQAHKGGMPSYIDGDDEMVEDAEGVTDFVFVFDIERRSLTTPDTDVTTVWVPAQLQHRWGGAKQF
jgi:hypothetical protein